MTDDEIAAARALVDAVKVVELWPRLAHENTRTAMVDAARQFAPLAAERGHVLVIDNKHDEMWEASDEKSHHHRLCLMCGHWVGNKITSVTTHGVTRNTTGVITLYLCGSRRCSELLHVTEKETSKC